VRVAPEVVLTAEQHSELLKLSRSRTISARLVQRVRIVLLASEGHKNKEIAEKLGIGSPQVARWRERYLASGLAGIEHDLPRGAPPRKARLKAQHTGVAGHWRPRWVRCPLNFALQPMLFRPPVGTASGSPSSSAQGIAWATGSAGRNGDGFDCRKFPSIGTHQLWPARVWHRFDREPAHSSGC